MSTGQSEQQERTVDELLDEYRTLYAQAADVGRRLESLSRRLDERLRQAAVMQSSQYSEPQPVELS